MIQIYLFFGSVGLLFLIFAFQGLHLKNIDRLRNRVAERIKLQKRAERIEESQKVTEERRTKRSERKTNTTLLPEIKALYRRAEADFSRGNHEQAEQILVQLLALDPEHLAGNEKLALIYLKTDRARKAEIIYLNLLKIQPENPVLLANLGLAYYKQNNYREATVFYEKAITFDSKKPARFASLGQIYLLTRQPKKALESFERAFRRDRRNVEYLFLMSEAQKQMGNWEKAREIIERILELQPYNQIAKDDLRKLSEQHVLAAPEE